MTVPPKSIEVGKCYLMGTILSRIRRVEAISAGGIVHFKARRSVRAGQFVWIPGTQSLAGFASRAEREVPCDWTPNTDEA